MFVYEEKEKISELKTTVEKQGSAQNEDTHNICSQMFTPAAKHTYKYKLTYSSVLVEVDKEKEQMWNICSWIFLRGP